MYLDDIKLGMEVNTEKVLIDGKKMIAFAKEYDPFPVHTDEEYAKNTRFGKVIAPGVMTFMAVWEKVVESGIFSDELIAGKSTKIEWFKPVFADDLLYGKGRITNVVRRNPYNGIAELTLDVYNQNDELVLQGIIESIVAYRTNN